MIHKDPARSPIANGPPAPATVDTFESAIAEVAQLTLALTSAIRKLGYADGARLRGELERALSRAQALAEGIAGGSERAEALRQLGDMQDVATRMLMIAPAPSSAAIEAAEAGDRTAWQREEQAWIAGRQPSDSSPRIPERRRERKATRPDSPKALRDMSGDATVPTTARGPNSPPVRPSGKAGTR
jgi:hypothetical protein